MGCAGALHTRKLFACRKCSHNQNRMACRPAAALRRGSGPPSIQVDVSGADGHPQHQEWEEDSQQPDDGQGVLRANPCAYAHSIVRQGSCQKSTWPQNYAAAYALKGSSGCVHLVRQHGTQSRSGSSEFHTFQGLLPSRSAFDCQYLRSGARCS